MIFILLLILLVTVAFWKLSKHYNYWSEKSVKQRKQVYLLGDNLGMFLGKESIFEWIINMYMAFPEERYAGIYQMLIPTLMIRDPELIKQIAVKDFDHFVNHRSFIPEGVEPIFNKNLFSLKDTAWRDMRQTLSPSFTSSKMKMMFMLISECADEFTDHFFKKGDSQILEMKDTFTRYTNDVIASVAFGIKCNSIKERDNDFFTMGTKATKFGKAASFKFFLYLLAPALCRALNLRFFPKDVSDFFMKVVKETIELRESQGIIRPDMMNLLLEARKGRTVIDSDPNEVTEAGFATVKEAVIEKETKPQKKYLTDLDIAAQALLFFFGGFESVSTLMNFAAYELTLKPDIQKRLQVEIDETLANCDGKLTYEALMKMKYMDMVISETLRKWPAGIVGDRVCTKTYSIKPTQANEHPLNLEPGDTIWIPIVALHYDPKYYPNPGVFDPERFSDENKDKIKPYTYLPFGLGPRNCIGSRFALMESKTILFYLLSKFDFCICEKTDIPIRLDKKVMQLITENGTWIELKPRSKFVARTAPVYAVSSHNRF